MPVVEGGAALDLAVCFPAEGDGDGSAGAQQRLARDVGTRALQLLRKHFGIGMLACEWCALWPMGGRWVWDSTDIMGQMCVWRTARAAILQHDLRARVDHHVGANHHSCSPTPGGIPPGLGPCRSSCHVPQPPKRGTSFEIARNDGEGFFSGFRASPDGITDRPARV